MRNTEESCVVHVLHATTYRRRTATIVNNHCRCSVCFPTAPRVPGTNSLSLRSHLSCASWRTRCTRPILQTMRLTDSALFRFACAVVPATIISAALTPALANQSSRWKEIGKTSAGNAVFVDPKSITKGKDGIITARVRVAFAKPVEQPKGPAWMQSRHIAMFDCAKKTVAAKETIYYADEAATRVVSKSVPKIPGFGSAIGGSM